MERSGQGVDKIYYNTLSEGKSEPDYSGSDDFKVELVLSATMKDRGFALFIESIQQALPDDRKLSVLEILTLSKIRDGISPTHLDRVILRKLLARNLIEKRGKTRGISYVLERSYYDFTGDLAEYQRRSEWSVNQMFSIIVPLFDRTKMGDFVKLLEGHMTRRQIRVGVQKLVEGRILVVAGEGSGTRYSLSESYKERSKRLNEALVIGLKEMAKRND